MLKKGSSALKAAYLGSVIISLQVCRCAVPKRLRRRRNEQTNCDKYRWRRVVELQCCRYVRLRRNVPAGHQGGDPAPLPIVPPIANREPPCGLLCLWRVLRNHLSACDGISGDVLSRLTRMEPMGIERHRWASREAE